MLFRFKYIPPPEPLVTIVVRTINRTLIGPGEFYIFMDEYSDVRYLDFSDVLVLILRILPIQDFLQFSMSVFNINGKIKPSLYQLGSPERGTGVWGKEVNRGILAYVEEIRVNSKYQRQGVGRWAIENVLNCDALAVRISLNFSFILSDTLEALSLFFSLGHCSQYPFTFCRA